MPGVVVPGVACAADAPASRIGMWCCSGNQMPGPCVCCQNQSTLDLIDPSKLDKQHGPQRRNSI